MRSRINPRRLVGLGRPSADYRRTWARRIHDVATTLGRTSGLAVQGVPSEAELERALGRVIHLADRAEIWLALAAASGQLPLDRDVVDVCRRAEFAGSAPLLAAIMSSSTADTMQREVRIVSDGAVVDVHHTAHTVLATGIQRVARETSRRWAAEHPCTMVAWLDDFVAMRELTDLEASRMSATSGPQGEVTSESTDATSDSAAIIVPWATTYLLPELVADRERNRRLLALARHSPTHTGVIGFDCIPLTSGDTSDSGVPDFFADHLATVRHFDRVTTISRAAGAEYGGWRTMLGAIGLPGPLIQPVLLPAEVPSSTPDAVRRAKSRFVVAGLPLVLCVGTHEPRKNHLALLHAAELLWQEGHEFSLTFVGGHSWRSSYFQRRLAELQAAGRPVESASGISDELLWAAYRLARCSVFASLNEGFGLPAAESLAAGTPVITSGYGSMAEIGNDGGTLLVDPRDDASIQDALRTMLVDQDAYERLRRSAANRPRRTWDDYARETWAYLTSE